MVLEELDEEGRGQVEAVGPVRRRTELTDLGKIILLKGKFMFLDNCELSKVQQKSFSWPFSSMDV